MCHCKHCKLHEFLNPFVTSLVSELTNHITTGTSEEMDGETGQDFSSYFPHFVLVVRDFFLSLEINGRCCTSDEYLEHALRLKPGVSERVKSYNKPRECLREYFPHRNCYTLPRPVDSDLQLKTMERVAMSDIRPEFLHLAENAVGGIIEAAREFKINNNTITGKRKLCPLNLFCPLQPQYLLQSCLEIDMF